MPVACRVQGPSYRLDIAPATPDTHTADDNHVDKLPRVSDDLEEDKKAATTQTASTKPEAEKVARTRLPSAGFRS